jgi:hypothetical protein
MSATQAIPKFAVPEITDAEMVFGARDQRYLSRAAIPDDFYEGHAHWCQVASALFFDGGALSDHGLKFKEDIDRQKAMRALRALLSSFAPKHEVKIGTVGVALANWCEEISSSKAEGK